MVKAMMRLFRLFYLNSKDFFPNGHFPEEVEQVTRLESTLDNCLKDTTAMEFNYTMFRDPKFTNKCRTASEEVEQENGEWKETNVTYSRCSQKLSAVNFSYAQNVSGEAEIFKLYHDSNLTIAPDLTFKLMQESHTFGAYHDYPTETVWKIISFGHFYCAKYFRDTPADHSALMTKMEDLFNEDIIYRWTRPGSHSNKIWEFLYSAFDLKKFAEAVDACVTSAKAISEYPEWLYRPTMEVRRRKKRSLAKTKTWSGSAYCLQDPWDPVMKLVVPISGVKCAN